MTESEWLTCTDPAPILEFLRGKASERKLRLLGVACARASWNQLEDARSRRAIEMVERFADGEVDAAALKAVADDAWAVRDELWDAGPEHHDDRLWLAEAAALTASVYEWRGTFTRPITTDNYPFRLPTANHCELLRDIFGNPFAAPQFDPSWASSIVVAFATQMYASRDFTTAPILADALQDAGCDDAAILGHLRGEAGHVRGCWVVDAVLGKE